MRLRGTPASRGVISRRVRSIRFRTTGWNWATRPIIAGVIMLGWWGGGGGDTDIDVPAHVFGFGAGALLGFGVAFLRGTRERTLVPA